MQRTNKFRLMPTKKQRKILNEMMYLSSCVYNITNYTIRQQFFNKEKILNFFGLQQQIQNTEDYQNLGRSYSLPRIQIYSETNSARFRLIKSKKQKKVGLLKYFKNRKTNTTIPSYLVIDGCQHSVKDKYVIIPLSRRMRKKYDINTRQFRVRYNGILKWKGKQQRGQIHFKNKRFYMYQCVESVDMPKIKSNKKAGLDIGIKKHIAVFANNNKDKVIGNKRFFRHWKYLTDLISKEQSKLNLMRRKISKNLLNLFDIRTKWQNNLFNNIVAKLFRFLKKYNVSVLYVGDVKHIRKNNNKGNIVNQMTHNYWSFDKLYKKIENKCEEFGIEMIKVKEYFTSITCPICGERAKSHCKDRIFICSYCDYVEHRDIVGSQNILIKGMCSPVTSTHWIEAYPLEVVT